MGATGILCPLIIPTCRLRNEILFYLVCLIVLFTFFILPSSQLSIVASIALLSCFLISLFLFFTPKQKEDFSPPQQESTTLIKSIIIFISGCIFLPLGGHFLVSSAINIASSLGLSKAFISLFAVALGTSLPELATSLIAAKSGNTDLALGNILGSNIFNITLVLG